MQHKISHGDIKPENIIFLKDKDKNNILKLIDWATWTNKINSKQPNTYIYFNNPNRKRDPETK